MGSSLMRRSTLIRYLDTVALFHDYSFGNCMMIAVQLPIATFVAGFQRWKQLGRQVKKGEKGKICYPGHGRRHDRTRVQSGLNAPFAEISVAWSVITTKVVRQWYVDSDGSVILGTQPAHSNMNRVIFLLRQALMEGES